MCIGCEQHKMIGKRTSLYTIDLVPLSCALVNCNMVYRQIQAIIRAILFIEELNSILNTEKITKIISLGYVV